MTTISWWRSWHGAPTDHKWAAVAARAGVKAGVVSAVAWALLDHASQHNERGCVTGFDTETYAIYSGFDEAEVVAVIKAMTDKGLLVGGHFVNWEKRQPKREDNSTERVRNWRAMKRSVTQCNTPDKDTDKDTEEEEGTVVEDEAIPFHPVLPVRTLLPAPPPPAPSSKYNYGNSPFGDHTPGLCIRLYKLVTGQDVIPSAEHNKAMHDLEAVLDYYQQDIEKAAPDGQRIFAKWCTTKRKDGGFYGKTNTAWLTWWLEELAPRPSAGPVDISQMSPSEFLEWMNQNPEAAQRMLEESEKE